VTWANKLIYSPALMDSYWRTEDFYISFMVTGHGSRTKQANLQFREWYMQEVVFVLHPPLRLFLEQKIIPALKTLTIYSRCLLLNFCLI